MFKKVISARIDEYKEFCENKNRLYYAGFSTLDEYIKSVAKAVNSALDMQKTITQMFFDRTINRDDYKFALDLFADFLNTVRFDYYQ